MKKNIVFICLALLFSCQAFATMNLLPADSAIWVQNGFGYGDDEFSYGMAGDTTINDTIYHKIYFLDSDTLINVNNTKDYNYVGGLRQEGSKIYFRAYSDGEDEAIIKESVLYDFGAKANTTITYNIELRNPYIFYYGPYTFSETYIYNADSDTLEVQSHFCSNSKWIPGVGSERGLFFPIESAVLTGSSIYGSCDYKLFCLKVKGNVIYMDRDGECKKCFAAACPKNDPDGIENIKYKDCISVSYNKDIQGISVNMQCPFNSSSCEIINIQGQTVYQRNYTESFIHVSELASGLYIVRVTMDGYEYTQKIEFKK